MSAALAPLTVATLRAGEEAEWARFLAAAENGTLFHDLDFLAYHPPQRFRFRHLVVRRGEAIVALIPGGLAGPHSGPLFTSPLGASVGGPVVPARLSSAGHLELVAALQDHSRREGWGGFEITLPPAAYWPTASDTLSFALFCRGFRLQRRWLCQMIPLAPGGSDRYRTLYRERMAGFVRAGRRNGIVVVEGGHERLDDFRRVFDDTYQRHGVAPTHSIEEIADLLHRLPQRVRLYLAMLHDIPISGLMVLMLSPSVAYSFYICASTAHAQQRGTLVAFAALLDRLADAGYRWLDLGPSASDGHFNEGVSFFKEGLGAAGYCRDRWAWSAQPGEPSQKTD